jgi:glycosyltransferase involved in cell wall biosynthesis
VTGVGTRAGGGMVMEHGRRAANGAAAATRTTSSATRPLRVAQIVTKLTAGAGGITLRGAAALDPMEYRTTILTAGESSLIAPAEAAGLEVIRLRHMARGRGLYPSTDTRGVRELLDHLRAGGFDVVHTHSAKAGAIGRLAARRAGVPAVVHSFHGFPFHQFQPAVVRRTLLTAERGLSRVTDYFLADGTMIAAEAIRLRLAAPGTIRAIASPVDGGIPAATPETRRRARLLLGLPENARVVGTAARLSHQKAPLDMVRALARLGRPDVLVAWVGGGELRSPTEREIRRAGLEGRFLLLGERSDVPALLPAFDVFALPSLYEGLPCALVEAMTCGIPVVATAVNSVPEIVIAGKTGLLARPGDPSSLASALAFMLDHPAAAAEMSAAAQSHIGAGFRPDVHARDLVVAYNAALELAARRGRRRVLGVA